MKKYLVVAMFLFFQLGCQSQRVTQQFESTNLSTTEQAVTINAAYKPAETTKDEIEADENAYPGVAIDQKFPFIEHHHFTEDGFDKKSYQVKAAEFQVTIEKLSPKNIIKNGKTIFTYKTIYPNDYSSNLVGVSHLLGADSKQIYVATTGPGGVCCTNYWITDVTGKTPKNIFRSEDFGGFRDPMEIFDGDGDGIYEIVQYDSAFRYFNEECGACSPEPRAVFKYNKKIDTYLPAKNIQQDFVKESFHQTEKWLGDAFDKLRTHKNIELNLEFQRRSLAHIIDLFYLGDTKKAWKTFDKHYFDKADKEKIRAEIKKRLRQSKFYQALQSLAE